MFQQPAVWFFALFSLQTFSHILRAVRWKYLIDPVKNNISIHNAFSSLMIGFMINGIIPRAGELVRSYVLGKKENIAASTLVSTVILERILDVISFASVLFIVAVLNAESIIIWFPSLPGAKWYLYAIASTFLGVFILLFLKSSIIFSFVKRISTVFPASSKITIDRILDSFLKGFQAGTHEKNYLALAVLTVSIWSTYIFLLYLPFRLFGMNDLTLSTAATLQVSNGIASAMPTPNGIGSYHSFIALTLTRVFRVNESLAIAYVVYTHAIAYLCTLLIGSAYLLKENIHITELMKAKGEK